eukprot:5099552-Prymnesium_polylepis.1
MIDRLDKAGILFWSETLGPAVYTARDRPARGCNPQRCARLPFLRLRCTAALPPPPLHGCPSSPPPLHGCPFSASVARLPFLSASVARLPFLRL